MSSCVCLNVKYAYRNLAILIATFRNIVLVAFLNAMNMQVHCNFVVHVD